MAAGAALVGLYAGIVSQLPVLNARIHSERAEPIRIYDAGSPPVLLTEIGSRYASEPLQVANLPDPLINAALASVDQDFLVRGSLDLNTVARTLLAEIRGTAADTASPITLGFIRQAYVRGTTHSRPQLYETALAYRLEQAWSKKRIVTEYLNTLYFGDGAYGVAAAAESYFGKDVDSLSAAECAFLLAVALHPSPPALRTYPESSLRARDAILNRMFQLNFLDGPALQEALADPLSFSTQPEPTVSHCPAWADLIERQLVKRYGVARVLRGGLAVYTTLQLPIQEMAEAAILEELALPGDPVGALLAIDVDNGTIVAMAQTQSGEREDVFFTPHEAPELYFPIALGTAFTYGVSPLATYECQDGSIILADAAICGDTTVYTKLTQQVGWDVILRTGAPFKAPDSSASEQSGMMDDVIPPALTIMDGGALYVPLAAGGRQPSSSQSAAMLGTTQLPTVVRVESLDGSFSDQATISWDQILDEQSAYLVEEILAQTASIVPAFSNLNFRVAGQASAVSSASGAWFVGFANGLLAVVWVGFPDGATFANMEGGLTRAEILPAQIWANFMKRALADRPTYQSDVSKTGQWCQVVICSSSGDLASSGCPKTRTLMVPESLAPSDICRLHARPVAETTTTTETVPTTSATVPSLAGLTPAEAEARLVTLGLAISVTVGAPGEQPGRIVAQNPAAGASLEPGRTVAVIVQGAPPTTVTTLTAPTTVTSTTLPPSASTSSTNRH
ncbi:MAG: PASTA domain-containing protein [Actinobacteria bacterium]|nr:PASTA domain-containing protein [Actinomycetota bacterium]